MKENVYFKIDGEWFTDFIRNLYYAEDKSYEECKEKLLNSLCLQELNEEEKNNLVDQILFGEKKLIGINELDLVDDEEFDVYNYSRFSKPRFKEEGLGVRGILTREGLFVKCGYMEHSYTIEKIGIDKCKGSLAFWKGLMGCGVSKDEYSNKITKHQKRWFEENKKYLNNEQIENWELLRLNERRREKMLG